MQQVPGGSAMPHDLNEPVAAFDFNRNNQIDFNDIVILFNTL